MGEGLELFSIYPVITKCGGKVPVGRSLKRILVHSDLKIYRKDEIVNGREEEVENEAKTICGE